MTMLYKNECLELGLPEPNNGEKQTHYLTRAMTDGHQIDTRMSRYIGVGNLHSVVSALTKMRIPFSLEHRTVKCPKTKEVPPYPVDVIWMTEEQINAYWEKKKGSEQ